jgi:hypothetical protein
VRAKLGEDLGEVAHRSRASVDLPHHEPCRLAGADQLAGPVQSGTSLAITRRPAPLHDQIDELPALELALGLDRLGLHLRGHLVRRVDGHPGVADDPLGPLCHPRTLILSKV